MGSRNGSPGGYGHRERVGSLDGEPEPSQQVCCPRRLDCYPEKSRDLPHRQLDHHRRRRGRIGVDYPADRGPGVGGKQFGNAVGGVATRFRVHPALESCRGL